MSPQIAAACPGQPIIQQGQCYSVYWSEISGSAITGWPCATSSWRKPADCIHHAPYRSAANGCCAHVRSNAEAASSQRERLGQKWSVPLEQVRPPAQDGIHQRPRQSTAGGEMKYGAVRRKTRLPRGACDRSSFSSRGDDGGRTGDGLCGARQNMPLAFFDSVGTTCRTSQCSTILPSTSRRKMSMPAYSWSPGQR